MDLAQGRRRILVESGICLDNFDQLSKGLLILEKYKNSMNNICYIHCDHDYFYFWMDNPEIIFGEDEDNLLDLGWYPTGLESNPEYWWCLFTG